jgi:hypothetical protein
MPRLSDLENKKTRAKKRGLKRNRLKTQPEP